MAWAGWRGRTVPRQRADDAAASRGIAEQVEYARNSRDGAAFALPFADAAEYVAIAGRHINGARPSPRGHPRQSSVSRR